MNPSGDSIRVVHPLFQTEGGGSTPTSPLQLHVGRVTVEIASKLNQLWHSRLPDFTGPHGYCKAFAAEFEGRYYASAIWSPPLARMLNWTGRFELRRMAISPDAPKNTGSRMLRIMRLLIPALLPDVRTLISYQDTDVHAGTIYKAAGWVAVSRSNVSEKGWNNRDRRVMQTTADKVRWECQI